MNADDHTIVVTDTGDIVMIYADDLLPLMTSLGDEIVTTRASHVEPEYGSWVADMGPVGGPRLTATATRAEALAREREWLLSHAIPVPGADSGRPVA